MPKEVRLLLAMSLFVFIGLCVIAMVADLSDNQLTALALAAAATVIGAWIFILGPSQKGWTRLYSVMWGLSATIVIGAPAWLTLIAELTKLVQSG